MLGLSHWLLLSGPLPLSGPVTPVSFSDCPPACLLPLLLFTVIRLVHLEPPKHSSWLSQKLVIQSQGSLSLCRTFLVSRCRGLGSGRRLLTALWAITLHVWPPHLKQPFCCLAAFCPTLSNTCCNSKVCRITAIAFRLASVLMVG